MSPTLPLNLASHPSDSRRTARYLCPLFPKLQLTCPGLMRSSSISPSHSIQSKDFLLLFSLETILFKVLPKSSKSYFPNLIQKLFLTIFCSEVMGLKELSKWFCAPCFYKPNRVFYLSLVSGILSVGQNQM